MKKHRMYVPVLGFVLILSSLNMASVVAAGMDSIGGRVFLLQKKMALRGNALAQYKLGTFYEFGVSVKPDVNEAKGWYEKAVSKKYRPAINRLKYLEIKASGYDQAKYGDWLKNIKAEAQAGRADALILLGQMYHHGYGVKKNLKKSLALLLKASAMGHPEIQLEIDDIESRLKPKKVKPKKAAPIVAEKPVEKKAPVKKLSTQEKKSSVAQLDKEKARKEKEAKRRRYEAAMKKYYQDQLILQKQQEWSESQDGADEDLDVESETL